MVTPPSMGSLMFPWRTSFKYSPGSPMRRTSRLRDEKMNSHILFTVLDLTGAFVFALSGAVAAKERNLDLFGIVLIAFIVACGGGIIRDLCIGDIPPFNLTHWPYLVLAVSASAIAIGAGGLVMKLNHSVRFFDSVGLGLLAAARAQNAWAYHERSEVVIG